MEVTLNLKDELSSAGMRLGVPSVTASGQRLMLMWLADSWDLHHLVYGIYAELVEYFTNDTVFFAGAIARTNAFFGQGTGPIWLDDLLCRGNERRLIDCPVSTGGIGMVDFCNGHADDAGVTCQERKHFSHLLFVLRIYIYI